MKNLLYFLLICFTTLFFACTSDSKSVPEKTKQVEAEVFFKSGNHGIFTYDLAGELKLDNNNLIDFDSSYCGCGGLELLATNVEAFKIITTTSLIDTNYSQKTNISQTTDTLKTINY